jgi:hypothetical protein
LSTFNEALSWLALGENVARIGWPRDQYCYEIYEEYPLLYMLIENVTNPVLVTNDDKYANDWLLY